MVKYATYIRLMLVIAVMLMPTSSFAAGAFGDLTEAGNKIFEGLREIIYPASAVGIIAVCIGGFFGNINWKWLTAIIIGLVVISLCAGFVAMFTDESAASAIPNNVMTGA